MDSISVRDIVASLALEAVPVPSLAEAKKAAKARKNLVQEDVKKAAKNGSQYVDRKRRDALAGADAGQEWWGACLYCCE